MAHGTVCRAACQLGLGLAAPHCPPLSRRVALVLTHLRHTSSCSSTQPPHSMGHDADDVLERYQQQRLQSQQASSYSADEDAEQARLSGMGFSGMAMESGHQVAITGRHRQGSGAVPESSAEREERRKREREERNRIDKRQYLTYSDAPGRTVSERERNHNTIRAVRVQGAALDYQRRVRGEVNPHHDDFNFDKFSSFVEARIQMAMAEGEFDNLQNKGQPLRRLTEPENPHLNDDDRWAFNMLQSHGYRPDWIENQRAIKEEMTSAKSRLRRFAALRCGGGVSESSWRERVAEFKATVDRLNKRVRDHNLTCPQPCQLPLFNKLEELADARGANASSESYPAMGHTDDDAHGVQPPAQTSSSNGSGIGGLCRVSLPSLTVSSVRLSPSAVTSPDGRSLWTRMADAFKRPAGAGRGGPFEF